MIQYISGGIYSGIPLNSVWEKFEGGKRDETVFSALKCAYTCTKNYILKQFCKFCVFIPVLKIFGKNTFGVILAPLVTL
jgi:hypothetical protein